MKVVDNTIKQPETNNAYVLVDRSGSMCSQWDDTVGSVNTYVKELPGNTNVTLVFFNSSEYTIQYHGKASEFVAIDNNSILPMGGTPLYDAMGKLMDTIFEENPSKAVLVVMTDGYENGSSEYSVASIKAKLTTLEEKKYAIVYLGAAFKEVETYSQSTFGIKASSTLNTSGVSRGYTMSMTASKSADYFGSGNVEVMAFSGEEKEEANKE